MHGMYCMAVTAKSVVVRGMQPFTTTACLSLQDCQVSVAAGASTTATANFVCIQFTPILCPEAFVQHVQGIGRLQAKRISHPAPSALFPSASLSPGRRPQSAAPRAYSPMPTTTGRSPTLTPPLYLKTLLTPVALPVVSPPVPASTADVRLNFSSLPSPLGGNTRSIWASSPSIDSHTYRAMFMPGSSCSSNDEGDSSTPRSSTVLRSGSSHSSSGKDSQTSFKFLRPGSGSDDSAPSPSLKYTAVTKSGSRHSSSGEDSLPSPTFWSMIRSPLPSSNSSPAAAVLATPASVETSKARGMTSFKRWHYRHGSGSCSSLGSTLDWDESSPDASQGLQSAQRLTPPSHKPKPMSRQQALEEHWYGHSSCSEDDSDVDMSAVSGGTRHSEATRSPAATAILQASSVLTATPDPGSLRLYSPGSYGELDFSAYTMWLDTGSPLPSASVQSQCPVPGTLTSSPSQLSPTSAEAVSPMSTGTARMAISSSVPLPAAEQPTRGLLTATEVSRADGCSSVTPANRPTNNSASVSRLSIGSAASLTGNRSAATAATAASMANSSGSAGDRRHSRGSTSFSATGRPSLSGSQSRRPSWSIAGLRSPAVSVTPEQLAPALARAAAPVTRASTRSARLAGFQRASTGTAAAATLSTAAAKDRLTPSTVNATRPSYRGAVPSSTAAARPTCRATALTSIAEARGSTVQGDRAAAPRTALRSSSAAGEPVQRSGPSLQSSRAAGVTVPASQQEAPPTASTQSESTGSRAAANRGLRSTPVPALAAGVRTRRQAAAAAAAGGSQTEGNAGPGVGAAPTNKPTNKTCSLKPEAPARRQPRRAARPQWH